MPKKLSVLFVFLFTAFIAEASSDTDANSFPDNASTNSTSLPEVDDVEPREWGIRNNCVSINRIRNFSLIDNKSAVLEMLGGKKILMRFKQDCSGLRHNGFVYSSRSGQLCARFDSIKVLQQGSVCRLESFEPYIELEEPESQELEPSVTDASES